MYENDQNRRPSPTWWEDSHESGWQRARSAMRRDWDQTKSDFTAGRKGADLNQNVGDTVAQALGKKAIPGPNTPNPMTPQESMRHVRNAAKRMDHEAERWAKDAEKAIDKTLTEKTAEAHRWEDAERPIRYGYGAASYYGVAWSDDTERRLRAEWTGLHPEEPWEDVRIHVRRGWDEAAR